MSRYQLIIKEEAAKEIAEAYGWYEMQQHNLGERFIACIETCFDTIDLNPNMFAKIYLDYRQAIVKNLSICCYL